MISIPNATEDLIDSAKCVEELKSLLDSPMWKKSFLSKKEIALVNINYPNTDKYTNNEIEFIDFLGLRAELIECGVKDKNDLIGQTKSLSEWKTLFHDYQIKKLKFK
jgi:hypothetical protein